MKEIKMGININTVMYLDTIVDNKVIEVAYEASDITDILEDGEYCYITVERFDENYLGMVKEQFKVISDKESIQYYIDKLADYKATGISAINNLIEKDNEYEEDFDDK